MALESSIQSKIVATLTRAGYIVLRNTVCNLKGWPDLTVYRRGRTAFIEVKRPGKEPTELQAHRHKQLRAEGFDVHVIDSVEQVRDIF